MTGERPVRLLMLSIGGMLGQNVLDCLRGRRQEVFLVGIGADAASPRNFQCDKSYLAPQTSDVDGFLVRLEQVIERECPDLVIPGRDEDLLILAALRDRRPDLASILACGSGSAAALIRDKWLTYEFSMRHGLRFAESALSEDGGIGRALEDLVARHGFPILAKPRMGWGSGGVFLAQHRDHLARLAQQEDLIFQEYLDPTEALEPCFRQLELGVPLGFALPQTGIYAAQTLIAPDGTIAPICCTVNRLVMGRPEWSAPCRPASLEALAMGYAVGMASAGWRGPLNIQAKELQDGSFCAFELNGRFTASTSTRLGFGYDELGQLVQAFVGAGRMTHWGVEMDLNRWAVKTLREDVVHASEVQQLEANGCWIK